MKTIEEQLILHEGLILKPYKCPAGYWTIGVGRNLEAKGLTREEQCKILGQCGLSKADVIEILKERGITKDEALFLLASDVAAVQAALSKHDWYSKLDEVRKKVVVDMAFNLGVDGILKFKKMIAALKRGDYEAATAEMVDSKWHRQVKERAIRLEKMMLTGEDYVN